ncbi:putative glycerophosphodiester phosphodiesterase [Kockovaella imperatae]|uniref:Putative glycerophosphodiester phosphodiesterase n=1 Tax=Kockovaella imperatae TaxID=4999 RepID=A0A1Y1USC3_9TREE|nr:putative glycerophosphodiester phosphodiesterase [Kockovaella imperatae]ORX40537.1 putative glycerophosphodiester phosphodiesterase [Kockovaella imperatae]
MVKRKNVSHGSSEYTMADSNSNGSSTPSSTFEPAVGPVPTPFRQPKDIECWGHRGASALLPENTLASFRAAIEEGAEGIESDVHATADGVILMFHDADLDRTTDGTGLIRVQRWHGGIEHVRTKAQPPQPIPRFEELVALLMESNNRHVSLNIDCKMQNDPEKLFPEMARVISQHENWEHDLAPRLILGLWHPQFLKAAFKYLPLLTRYHIGFSPNVVRKYFWDTCHGFSLNFACLMGQEGQNFMEDCRKAGKEICVWTVNDPVEMRTAMTWGIKAILTDKVSVMTSLRSEVCSDPSKLQIPGLYRYAFPWSHWRYYSFAHMLIERSFIDLLRSASYAPGPLVVPDLGELGMSADAATASINGTISSTAVAA